MHTKPQLIFHSWVWECPPHPPPPLLWDAYSVFHSAARVGGHCGHWCGLSMKKKKKEKEKKQQKIPVRIGHFFSQGSNAHISSSSRPPSRVPHPQFSEQPPAFLENSSPLVSPLCTGLNLFFFYFLCIAFFFFLALTSNHLTRNEWMNVWKWLCVMLKLGNVFLQHVNMFFFSTHSHCEFFLFFHQTAKTKRKNKNDKKISPVTRLLSFIFVLFTFLLETIMFVMVTSTPDRKSVV